MKTIKPKDSCKATIGVLALCAVAVFGLSTAQAGTVTKANTGTDLNADASWVGNVAPTSADVATWVDTSLGSGLTLGADASWLGLSISNAQTDIDITGAGALTLGTGGFDMSSSAVNLFIANPVTLGADQAWSINSGITLTSWGVISGNFGLTKIGAGTLILSEANTFTGGMFVNDGTLDPQQA